MKLFLSGASLRGIARAVALAGLLLAGGLGAVAPSHAADALKTVRIFYPPLNSGWTAGYELIEVAFAQGYFKKYGLDAQRAVVPWDQYTVALDSGALDFTPSAAQKEFPSPRVTKFKNPSAKKLRQVPH